MRKPDSMSGVLALSGFLYGKNKRLLIFSVMVNNYNGLSRDGRRAIEKFIKTAYFLNKLLIYSF